jgi:hypothetical protein
MSKRTSTYGKRDLVLDEKHRFLHLRMACGQLAGQNIVGSNQDSTNLPSYSKETCNT